MLKFALCGLFGVTANQLMFFNGLKLTSTISTSIIMVTSPIIVSVLSVIILKEKLQQQGYWCINWIDGSCYNNISK